MFSLTDGYKTSIKVSSRKTNKVSKMKNKIQNGRNKRETFLAIKLCGSTLNRTERGQTDLIAHWEIKTEKSNYIA